MRASIVAANALLVVCIAVVQSFGTERAAAGATTPKLVVASSSPACRAAVWPYVPAECGTHDASRPVRVLRVETGR